MFAFEWGLNFYFLQMVIFTTLFERCPTLWKSTLKMTTLFRRCLTTLKIKSTLKWAKLMDVAQPCKFQRWGTQCCLNVDLTLCDVATSYQPKNNVETTLKCLLMISYLGDRIRQNKKQLGYFCVRISS